MPPGEIGEIVTRSDCVMRGYWNNPAANAKALRDGWLWTGDLGSHGRATASSRCKDRSKDMIITGGSNIYPREIEEVLLRHPGVLEAAVVGRPHRRLGRGGDRLRGRPRRRRHRTGRARRAARQHIARFKRPRDYRFVDALPKNNYGKILKTELRTLAAQSGG